MAAGKITKSNSSAGTVILLVKKPDGSFRLYLDHCAFNQVTDKYRYQLPLMTELRERLNMAKVFTKLHLKNRYQLVYIAEEDKEKTSFGTKLGLYLSRVMPRGLCLAPDTFPSMTDNIFHNLLDNGVIVYLDDILMYTKSVDKYIPLLAEVLS